MTRGEGVRIEPLRKPVTCPTCAAKSVRVHYPFCSPRCRELDLHKWFSGTYAITGSQDDKMDSGN